MGKIVKSEVYAHKGLPNVNRIGIIFFLNNFWSLIRTSVASQVEDIGIRESVMRRTTTKSVDRYGKVDCQVVSHD